MPVELTDEQYTALLEYFELSLTAVSDEEQEDLVFREKPLRDMLRSLSAER